jgi:hypothetical protein
MGGTDASFFFPSMLIGPSLDYVTYDSLVLKTIYNITPPGQDDSQAKLKRRVPHGRKRVAYLHLVIGLAFLGIYAVYGGRAAYQRVLTPTWYTWSLLSRFGFVQLAGIVARIKYYAVWSLAEVSLPSFQCRPKLTYREHVSSPEQDLMDTTPRQVGHYGTDFETSTFPPSRLQRVSRSFSIVGTAVPMSG